MTRIEEKIYLKNVFDAIDQVYKMKKSQQISSYEERLRASFNKLIVPDWYNHEYTSTNGLRKTKSHGHVSRVKKLNDNNNNDHNHNSQNDDTPDTSQSSSTHSPHLSNGTYRQSYRHRSPSRSWSEKPPLRRDSTVSSYDTNTSVCNGRRSALSNGSATYAPGAQRVAQSSMWYKPSTFITKTTFSHTNGHSIEPPKPLPRYSKIDSGRINSSDSSSTKTDNVRQPIKPRTMTQPPIPFEDSILNTSSDGDVTIVPESSPIQATNEKSIPNQSDVARTNIVRTNSLKSVTSEAESYRSAVLPSTDKNLLGSDSSSYASINERCVSPSTASFHTARVGDTSSSSSVTGYETPTPQLDDDDDDRGTLSSHSSLSDLSHAETLEPNADDLDIVALSTLEQKTITVPSVDAEMENSLLPTFTSKSSNTDSFGTSDSRRSDNQNWYDGSLETCVQQTESSSNIREISNDEILHEIDINAVGDEFFLISPHNTTENDSLNILNDENKRENTQNSNQLSNRIFTIEDKTTNITNKFHYSSSNDPFDFDNYNTHSSLMITNLDDILNDDSQTNSSSNTNYRRPIQEDILYEVEHENSFSDNSQNTSSIVPTNDNTSIKADMNIDYLTSTDSPCIDDDDLQTSNIEHDKQTSSEPSTLLTTNENTVLPIYVLPPLYTTGSTEPTPSLHINTNDTIRKPESSLSQYSELTSPINYTPKIRHRQYSVGSYYDHKTTTTTTTTTVPLTPNYFLGSAPVSPLSRVVTTTNESHYHTHHHHSPTTYDNISIGALRRVNPCLDSNKYPYPSTIPTTSFNESYSSSVNKEEKTEVITYISPATTSTSIEKTIPITDNEPKPVIQQTVVPPTAVRTSAVTFSQFEIPITYPKSIDEIPVYTPQYKQESSMNISSPSSLPPKSTLTHENPTYESPKSSIRSNFIEQNPLISPPQPKPTKKQQSNGQNIYDEIDTMLSNTLRADLQFIRGTIDRVLHFHHDTSIDSPSDSNTYYEEVIDENVNSPKNLSSQYPSIEAVQRFYNHKQTPNSDRRNPMEQITNLDDIIISSSSASKKSDQHSSIINNRIKHHRKLKPSESERTSSEEVDDTLNDIEDVDYHNDGKMKRQVVNHYSHHQSTDTSNEISPLHLQSNLKNFTQETKTIEQQKPIDQVKRFVVPPIDIVTNMVIERDDIDENDNGIIEEGSSEVVIFYDDIEIVEHLTSCSSESDSSTSRSSSHHYSKPANISLVQPPLPPPIPARTLKPNRLLNNNNQQQQSQSSTINKAYELEKFLISKKFNVNTVSDMLNRTDYNMNASTVSHRHPSARHFVGKLNNDDMLTNNTKTTQPVIINGNEHKRTATKTPFATLPSRSLSTASKPEKHRSIIADTNALVKHIQSSLSRNSLHDSQANTKNLSSSTKDLRAFVSPTYSPTYSPTNENVIHDNDTVHLRPQENNHDDQTFKRQARLSKSFHNVSEYKSTDQYPKRDQNLTTQRTLPSKSVETNLNQVSQNQTRHSHIPLDLTSVVTRTSSSALQNSDENARMLSMKWYTGQVNENSEISYHQHHNDAGDLLHGYISAHSNRDTQAILARLQASNDTRIHTALDDIRSRVAQFDASKTRDDLHVFMRYLESRLRDLNNKISTTKITSLDEITNGNQPSNNGSVKSQINQTVNDSNKETSSSRQMGRQQLRSSTSNGNGINGHQPIPSRRSSQSSSNQENPVIFDEMLNTVLGLPKKGVSALPQTYPSKHERSVPLVQTQLTTNVPTNNKSGREVGKRLFESGIYKDPRLIYDGPRKTEKEEEPLETSV